MKILEKLPIVKKKNKTIKWFQTYSKNLYENLKIQWAKNEELEKEIKRKEEDNMLNQVVMVGRLVKEPTKEELVISVSRNYKNEDGLYDDDIFVIHHKMPSIVEQNVHEGDLVGVKGRLENNEIKAEKITFLAKKRGE